MLASLREKLIIKELNEKGIVNINDIAEKLNASLATIRRDLRKLENENKLIRVHGGAKQITSLELTMLEKLVLNYDEKKALCQKASEEIKDGDCIFIDGGTTLEPMYEFVKNKQVTVVTNNLLILKKVEKTTAKFISVGGDYLAHYSMMVGSVALKQLDHYHFDACFIGCTGVDFENDLIYTVEQETMDIKLHAIKNATNAYLIADSSKLNIKAFVKYQGLQQFNKIYTNINKVFDSYPNIENVKND